MSFQRFLMGVLFVLVFFGMIPSQSEAQQSSSPLVPQIPEQIADTSTHVLPYPAIVDSMHQAFLATLRQMHLPPAPLPSASVDSVAQQLQEMGQFVIRYMSWELSVPNRATVSPNPPSVLYDRLREFEGWVQHQDCITSAVIQELPKSRSGASSLVTLEPPELHLQVQFTVQGNATVSRTVTIPFNPISVLKLVQ